MQKKKKKKVDNINTKIKCVQIGKQCIFFSFGCMSVATVFIIGGNKSWWKINKGQHHKGRHALFESLIPHSKNMHHTVFFLSFPLCKYRGVLLLADPSKFACIFQDYWLVLVKQMKLTTSLSGYLFSKLHVL